MYDVVALGELLIDFTPAGFSEKGNVLFERNPGGAPANVLAALAKMGGKTAFIGKVGNDQFGTFLRDTLHESKIDTKGLIFSEETNTTLAFVHLNREGDRSFSFYRKPGADMMLREQEVDFDMIQNTRIFHFGSVSMTHEPSRSATLKAAGFAGHKGIMVSYDPNLRAPLWDRLDQARQVILEGMKYADLIKISEEELIFLTDTKDLEEGSMELCREYGTRLMLVTLGPRGCFYRLGQHTGSVPAFDVKTVDTTGAGDAFTGGILHKLIKSGKVISSLSHEEVIEMVRFANAVGSLATTGKGAIPAMPSMEEIQTCLQEGKLLE